MATTTATLSLTSSDLLSGPLSVSASTTLMLAGTTTGLEKMEMGRGKVTVADGSKSLKLATAAGDDGAGGGGAEGCGYHRCGAGCCRVRL